jgi:hypothetical protein
LLFSLDHPDRERNVVMERGTYRGSVRGLPRGQFERSDWLVYTLLLGGIIIAAAAVVYFT